MGSNTQHQTSAKKGALERLNPKHVPWYGKKMVQEHEERYLFASHFIKGKVIIELGCGNGYGTAILAKKGAEKIIATDIDPEAIAFAKKHFPHKKIEYQTADATKTGLPAKSADIVISFETLEHVTDPELMINEMYRLVKPGGTCIISTPNAATSFGDNPYHKKEFTFRQLQNQLKLFNEIDYFGQRKVTVFILTLYKKLHRSLPSSLRIFCRFRPWEGYTIHKLEKRSNPPYLYLIAVCHKTQDKR